MYAMRTYLANSDYRIIWGNDDAGILLYE